LSFGLGGITQRKSFRVKKTVWWANISAENRHHDVAKKAARN